MQVAIQNKLKECRAKAEGNILKLDALSPLKTLTRGYSIAEYNGVVLKSTNQIKENDEISIRLQDGKITATVKQIM